jgi:hypothetical protein
MAWSVILSAYGADTISEVNLFSILLEDLTVRCDEYKSREWTEFY